MTDQQSEYNILVFAKLQLTLMYIHTVLDYLCFVWNLKFLFWTMETYIIVVICICMSEFHP